MLLDLVREPALSRSRVAPGGQIHQFHLSSELMKHHTNWTRWFVISALVIVLDQLTKYWVS
ncbi:MAG: hypothetical protein ACREU0_09020, partial [Burkholderiales bacterium]